MNGDAYVSFSPVGGNVAIGGQGSLMSLSNQSNQSFNGAFAGLVLDAGALYFAADQSEGTGSVPDLGSPQFPCCNDGGFSTGSGGVWMVSPLSGSNSPPTPTMIGSAVTFQELELKASMVANTSSLYVMTTGNPMMGTVATILAIPKSGVPTTPFTTIDTISSSLGNQVLPVGFDANDSYLAWTVATNATSVQSVPGGCWVFSRGVSATATTQLLQTTQFACLDAALDDAYVYFTIVSSEPNDNNCDGDCQQPLHGDGIARVPIGGGALESLALGITAYAGGPRRIYLDSDNIYMIDPLAIAKIPKSTLAGSHDFSQ